MLTRNGWCLSSVRILRSLITDFTLLLVKILALLISFIAKRSVCFDLLSCTFQTLPKPPLPIHSLYLNRFLLTAIEMTKGYSNIMVAREMNLQANSKKFHYVDIQSITEVVTAKIDYSYAKNGQILGCSYQ